jgi:hypothetical protein
MSAICHGRNYDLAHRKQTDVGMVSKLLIVTIREKQTDAGTVMSLSSSRKKHLKFVTRKKKVIVKNSYLHSSRKQTDADNLITFGTNDSYGSITKSI